MTSDLNHAPREAARDTAGDLTIVGTPRAGSLRPLFAAVGLLFVAFPVINLLSRNPEPLEAALVIAATVIFGALILSTTRVPPLDPEAPAIAEIDDRRVWLSIAAVVALIAIASVLSYGYPGAGWFALFYYASTSASTIRSNRAATVLMAASGIAAGVVLFADEGLLGDAIIQGISVAVIGLVVYSAIAVRRTNRALVTARHELAKLAVADERSRIARDLHDTLGHSLSVIALKSELAGRLIDDDPARAKAEMADVERVARESLSAVRETVGGIRQPTLAAELAGARSALAAAGIDGRVEPAPEGIPTAVDAVLGWAVREGVTNIVRHARAGSAEIRVELADGSAGVDIRNDAIAERAGEPGMGPSRAGGGSGLVGLRERVAAFGGVVEAGPTESGGFRLHVSVPLA
jgi:two-component system, NarL family, sensor histidine kinase DesK